jgi:DNA-binding Lrp family transcriptional regulator
MKSAENRKQILRLLQQNARIGNQAIAERLQLAEATVAAAIRDMEQNGTIIGYHALVDEERAGTVSVRAMIEVEVQPEREGGFDRTAESISKFPEVQTVYLVSGRYDLRVEVIGDTLQEVAAFVSSKLAVLDGVKSTTTHFLLKKYKEAGFRLNEEEVYDRLQVSP